MMTREHRQLIPLIWYATATNDQLDSVMNMFDNSFRLLMAWVLFLEARTEWHDRDIWFVAWRRFRSVISRFILYCHRWQVLPRKLGYFLNKGHVISWWNGSWTRMTKIFNTPSPAEEKIFLRIWCATCKRDIDAAPDGYLEPLLYNELLNAAHIPVVKEKVVNSKKRAFYLLLTKQGIRSHLSWGTGSYLMLSRPTPI